MMCYSYTAIKICVTAEKKALRPPMQPISAAEREPHRPEDRDAAHQPGTVDTENEHDDVDEVADGANIFFAEDLTKARGNLAYRARKKSEKEQVMDSWVMDAQIMIRENCSGISQVNTIDQPMTKVNDFV